MRNRRVVFSLQGISYVFEHDHASGCERSILVLVFQDVFLSFSFQGEGGDPGGIIVFVG